MRYWFSVKITLPRRKPPQVGRQSFRAPNQGLESSSCYWIAPQRNAARGCFSRRHRFHMSCHAMSRNVTSCYVMMWYAMS